MNKKQLLSRYKLDQACTKNIVNEQLNIGGPDLPDEITKDFYQPDYLGWLKGEQGLLPDDTIVQDLGNYLVNLFKGKKVKDDEGRTNDERKRQLNKLVGPSPEDIQRRNIARQNAQDASMNQVDENKFARMVRILNNGKK